MALLVKGNITATPTWRAAELGSINGHSNARGVACILSPIALGGTVDGVHVLSPETIDLIFKEQTSGPDLVISTETKFGIGYGLVRLGPKSAGDWLPEGKICFWGGWGGSMVIMDVARGITITYMMNKMGNVGLGTGLAREYIWEIYWALGVAIPEDRA